ncbi:MAG TPA: filamentous hemagglutinin N-terminal domain-containing protein, partial [Verrucomicrobiae bacterium]
MNAKYSSHRISGSRWLGVVLAALVLRQNRGLANPTGMTVAAGSASAQQLGSQLNITVSQAAILNWQSFNIGAGETTSFLQPSANSVVLNLIGGANPSQILGNLNANGTVILENANGFYFGSGSMIKVGGSFIATTAAVPPDLGGASGGWQFTGMPPLASIVNYGQIEVGAGKSLFLIAENIENHGSLNAPGGSVDLAAGQTVLVSESPDGRGLSAAVTLPQGSVDNFGRVIADGGHIMMQAKVVNQNGLLQADSVQNRNGVIELVASDQLNLGANSQILARGDDSADGSAGGTVTLKS